MNVIGQIQTSRGAWLARRDPIRLGSLTLRPSSLEVAGPTETVTLEPRCMKVLVTLCDHLGATVSRDAMIDQCWDGRIVSDAALNRSIAQVRKAQALDPALEIETIPRIGYRLKAPADGAAARVAPPPVPEAPRKRTWLFVTAGVAAVSVALLSWLLLPRSEWRGDQVRPAVTDPGVESYPALSPNGDRLAYAKLSPDGRWHLFVKSVDGAQGRQLTATTASDTWPSWRGDGEALAFVRVAGRKCAVVVLDLITSNQTELTSCDPDHIGHPTFAGPERLLYSDALPGTDQHAVYSLSLGDRTARPLSTPPAGAHGDMDPIVSPDGRHVVFRRVQAWGVDFLMVADLAPDGGLANVRALTDDGWKAHGVAWSSDGRAVIYSSNRGGDWGLWLVGVAGGKPQRISLGTTAITKIGGGPDGRLAVETYHARSDLRWLGEGSASVKSVMADVWTLSIGPKGDLAYVSNESGSPELWTQSSDQPTRLTHLKSSYLHDTVWNVAGDGIAFIAVHNRAPQIFMLPLRSGVPVQLTDVPGDKANPAFLTPSRMIWLGRGQHGWRLVTMDTGGKTAPAPQDGLGQDWTALKSGPGSVVGIKSGDPYLYRISLDNGVVRADRTRLQCPDTPFAVAKDGIVVARGTGLVLRRWEGTQHELIRGDDDAQPPAELAVDPKTGRVLAVDRSGNQSDLALMTLSRR